MKHYLPRDAIIYNDASFTQDEHGGLHFKDITDLAQSEALNPETDEYVDVDWDDEQKAWYWED